MNNNPGDTLTDDDLIRWGLELCDFTIERSRDCDLCKSPKMNSRVWVSLDSHGHANYYACEECAKAHLKKEYALAQKMIENQK